MRYGLFIIFLGITLTTLGQVKVEVTPTGKHAKALNSAKQSRDDIKAQKQAAKERKQQIKAAKNDAKQYKKARKDYLKRYQERYQQEYDSLKERVALDPPAFDSLAYGVPIDSARIAEEVLNQSSFPAKYRNLILNPPQFRIDTSFAEVSDSLLRSRAEGLAEQQVRDYIPDELAAPDDPLETLANPMQDPSGALSNPGTSIPTNRRPNPNLIKPQQAQELFKKVDPKQFADAQGEIQKLKKKYSALPDSRFPEEGTKRNSLQDLPFIKRLYFGGNVGLQSTDPLILNSNLQLGYWINKKWLAGVGIVYREQFSQQDSSALVTGDGYGYSFFTRYDIRKGFFAWAEGEFQINRSFFGSEQAAASSWQRAYLLGAGREFKLGPVRMMSMILYDFNYQDNTLNRRPWVFRMGWQFSKKPQ